MTDSGYIRKGLNTRLAEHLNAVGADWRISVTDDRLTYHVHRNGMDMSFTPGELADVLGLS